MQRVIEPEILDELKPGDPRASRARRDLRRINFWMGNAGWIQRSLDNVFGPVPPRRIVEIGAGDGSLLLKVAKRMKRPESRISLKLVDREPAIARDTLAQYRASGWDAEIVAADLFDWLKRKEPTDLVVANLFLHHFSEEQLRCMFAEAAALTSCFIACEPPRSRQALFGCRLMPLIGIGEVALYDAVVSIRAGFAEQELSAMWPKTAGWHLNERKAGLFTHLFVAHKKG